MRQNLHPDYKVQQKQSELKEQRTALNEIIAEIRRTTEKFYYQVALLCGGSIVLSVTYLGYLEAGSDGLACGKWLLVAAWVLLSISLLCSLLRNKLYPDYLHYSAMKDYTKTYKEYSEEMVNYLKAAPEDFANIGSKEDLDRFISIEKQNVATLARAQESHQKKKQRTERLWVACGRVALVGLVCGLAGLIVFAVSNVYAR